MVNSLISLMGNFKIKNNTQLHVMPLWYNSDLDFDFRKEWKNRGYLMVGDILNENGKILTIDELLEKELYIKFLDYFRIKKKINSYINLTGKIAPMQVPQIPRILFEIGFTQKGCNRIYNKLMNYSTGILSEVKDKWENALNENIPCNTIENAFKEISNIRSGSYQRYFQFKLLHSRTITN